MAAPQLVKVSKDSVFSREYNLPA